MDNSLLSAAVTEALGISTLSDNDQIAFLSTHGDAIFEAALTQFEPLLSEPDQQAVQMYLATDPEPEVLFNYLVNEYEQFVIVLEAVARDIKNQNGTADNE